MQFEVITLFPEMFAGLRDAGITRRAAELGLWSMRAINPRDFTVDVHRTVDDRPFGGGPGMVMLAEPLAQAVQAARAAVPAARVVSFAPNAPRLTDARVRALAAVRQPLVLVCGRYEGIDQRFIDACVDEEVSIGDFVLSGGEIAALALMDAVIRQLPGAIKDDSAAQESFAGGLLDGPQYTRPEVWRGAPVPSVLLSGHHAQIARWRREQALQRTRAVRPEMIDQARAAGLLQEQDDAWLRTACAQPDA